MDLSGTIPLLKSQIQSLEHEVQFLREDLKEKFFLVKSLVTAHVGLSEASLNNFFLKKSSPLLEVIIKQQKRISHHLLMSV